MTATCVGSSARIKSLIPSHFLQINTSPANPKTPARKMSNHPITGPPRPTPAATDGSVPIRLEIRALQQNADQWNLYLLGLDAFKKLDETSDLSFYGIAGIHGRPYRPWGGVRGDNRRGWQGYCTHTSILFAPWHRPYVALFEVGSQMSK
jgi:hypothetical protein